MSAHLSVKPKLLIVGNGMAAGRLVDELQKRDLTRYSLTIVGDEPQGSYNRIMLSSVLAEELDAESVIQKGAFWYKQNDISFIGGHRVASIDSQSKLAVLDNGQALPYDKLVLAMGSSPSAIPAKNQSLQNIFSFRTLGDVAAMTEAGRIDTTQTAKRAVVIGGGLLGLEAAYGLAQRGLKVVLVHRSGWLLSRQLDARAGELLNALMQTMNIEFRLNSEVAEFSGTGAVTHAVLTDGESLACDLAVIATGISPNKQLGETAGLHVNRAIVVDELMLTSSPHISAFGECCEFNETTFGLVEPIWQQCKTLAARLSGEAPVPFTLAPIATKLKVSGVQLFSAGEYITQPHHRELVMSDPASRIYRKLLIADNNIVGILLFGDTRDGNYYFDLMQSHTNVSALMPKLIFGEYYCAGAAA